MRRTPAATPPSETIANRPMSPVARTCVPPHSSTLKPGIETTRTWSPYFSPKSAIAPAAIASCVFFTSVWTARIAQDLFVDDALDLEQLLASHGADVHEVEAQPVGRNQRARLLDVLAEHLSKRGMEQVSRCVVAAGRVRGERALTSALTRSRARQLAAGDMDAVQARPVPGAHDRGDACLTAQVPRWFRRQRPDRQPRDRTASRSERRNRPDPR